MKQYTSVRQPISLRVIRPRLGLRPQLSIINKVRSTVRSEDEVRYLTYGTVPYRGRSPRCGTLRYLIYMFKVNPPEDGTLRYLIIYILRYTRRRPVPYGTLY